MTLDSKLNNSNLIKSEVIPFSEIGYISPKKRILQTIFYVLVTAYSIVGKINSGNTEIDLFNSVLFYIILDIPLYLGILYLNRTKGSLNHPRLMRLLKDIRIYVKLLIISFTIAAFSVSKDKTAIEILLFILTCLSAVPYVLRLLFELYKLPFRYMIWLLKSQNRFIYYKEYTKTGIKCEVREMKEKTPYFVGLIERIIFSLIVGGVLFGLIMIGIIIK